MKAPLAQSIFSVWTVGTPISKVSMRFRALHLKADAALVDTTLARSYLANQTRLWHDGIHGGKMEMRTVARTHFLDPVGCGARSGKKKVSGTTSRRVAEILLNSFTYPFPSHSSTPWSLALPRPINNRDFAFDLRTVDISPKPAI